MADPSAPYQAARLDVSPEVVVKAECEPSVPLTLLDVQSADSELTACPDFTQLQTIAQSDSTRTLEDAVKASKPLLRDIIQVLEQADDNKFIAEKLQSIRKLLGTRDMPQYILGVVGGTGHGKSSLINTLLGELELIPTSCVRACTAVVTEISWNDDGAHDHQYVAEVEYITPEEWQLELELLFSDLTTHEGGLARGSADKATEAGIAWAKIHAVHPNITKENLKNCDALKLASISEVQDLLGTTKTIKTATASQFCNEIRLYVDSKEMSTDQDCAINPPPENEKSSASGNCIDYPEVVDSDDDYVPEDDEDEEDEDSSIRDEFSTTHMKTKKLRRAMWPLIKAVRIRTKADILATGLVLVDLPGVADSNAARDAVAARYLKKCDGIWVVANITRAVNDKTAQNLLGQRFKQQLRFDGNYGNLTFICSKTDDLLVEEAWKQFDLGAQYRNYKVAKQALDEWNRKNRVQHDRMSQRSASMLNLISEVGKRLAKWEKLLADSESGKQVRVPPDNHRKRKVPKGQVAQRRKRLCVENTGTRSLEETEALRAAEAFAAADDLWDRLEAGPKTLIATMSMSTDTVRAVVEHLSTVRAATTEERESLDTRIEEERERFEELEEDFILKSGHLKSLCISKRNTYAQIEARRQFETGLRDMDELEAQEEDPDHFDPDATQRDYSDLAAELPVFCVSSRAYQAMAGLVQNDMLFEGYEDPSATQIPQLTEHALSLTTAVRIRHGKKFLDDVLELLYSLQMWGSDQVWDIELTDEEKQQQMNLKQRSLQSLNRDLGDAVHTFVAVCRNTLENRIFRRMKRSLEKSSLKAIKTAEKWPKRSGEDNGIRFGTYRAVCRRQGVFNSPSMGLRDFNEDLVAPLKEKLAKRWEKTFTEVIPDALQAFSTDAERLQKKFHEDLKAEFQTKVSFSTLNTLEVQLLTRGRQLQHKAQHFADHVSEVQKEASRQFNPVIQKKMSATYEKILEETGTGSFVRMQKIMADDLKSSSKASLSSAAATVKHDLEGLLVDLETDMSTYMAELLDHIDQDYTNVIGGDVLENTKTARNGVNVILCRVVGSFSHIPSD